MLRSSGQGSWWWARRPGVAACGWHAEGMPHMWVFSLRRFEDVTCSDTFFSAKFETISKVLDVDVVLWPRGQGCHDGEGAQQYRVHPSTWI